MESYLRSLRRLLSTVYVNSVEKLLWGCSLAHQWEAGLNHVKNHKTWCPMCSRTAMLSLSMAQQHAAALGGLCLSVTYVNSRTPLLWECAAGHRWTATFGAVRNRQSWCPKCAHERYRKGLRIAQAVAASRGGFCHSAVYKNMHSPLLWECAVGHTWRAALQSVQAHGSWCRSCFIQSQRLDIETAQDVARQRGGACLSGCYVNNATPLQWRCKVGHLWKAALNGVKDGGSWCPTCRTGRVECEVRELFEPQRHGTVLCHCIATVLIQLLLCTEARAHFLWRGVPKAPAKILEVLHGQAVRTRRVLRSNRPGL